MFGIIMPNIEEEETTMNTRTLSPRQQEVLRVIGAWVDRHGRPPTVREIAEALGVSSTATVVQHLRALESKGYLARERYRHRDLRPHEPLRRPPRAFEAEVVQVPLVGVIVAGRPLESVEVLGDEELVDIPASYLSTGEHFALRVRGESMIDDGICDGDVILVRRQDQAQAGQTVVALVEGEATVKRLYFHGAQAELRPANRTMEPIFVPRDQLTIQGVVISLLRRYR